jgi:hypothetical protein
MTPIKNNNKIEIILSFNFILSLIEETRLLFGPLVQIIKQAMVIIVLNLLQIVKEIFIQQKFWGTVDWIPVIMANLTAVLPQ